MRKCTTFGNLTAGPWSKFKMFPASVSRTIMLADILCNPRAAASFLPFRNTILGLPPAEPAPAQLSRVAPAAVSDHLAPAAAAGVAPRASMAAHSGSLPATELPLSAPRV